MTTDTAWNILGVSPAVNGKWKVIARKGSHVVHIDRLERDAADNITQAEITAFWRAGVRPSAPTIVDLMASI